MVADPVPQPHRRQRQQDEPMRVWPLQSERRNDSQSHDIGNDLRGPNRGVIGCEHIEELLEGKWRRHVESTAETGRRAE